MIDTDDAPTIDVVANETVVMSRVRRHWVILVGALSTPVLVALLSVAVGRLFGGALMAVTWVGLLVASVMAAVGWLRWYLEWLTLTSQRVVLEGGVLVRSIKVLPLDHVQDMATHQSILGQLLGYGTIEIDAIGREGIELVPGVPRPNRLRERVFEQQRLLMEETAQAGDGLTTMPPRRR